MEIHSKTLLWLLLSAAGAMACSSSAPPSPTTSEWACNNVGVPNGSTLECVATQGSAMTTAPAGSYTCPVDGAPNAACPPPSAGDTAPPYNEYDAGYDDDAGQGGDYTTGSGDVNTYDAGSTGGSNGNGVGNGGGNGHGNPHNDAGGSDNGGGYTSGGDTNGGSSDDCDAGGGSTNGGGGYTCSSGDGSTTCQQPPTCKPGTHASPCGACVADGTTEDCNPPSQGGCWVTGGGFIPESGSSNSFGGNAMPMKSGTIRGEWENVDHATGNKMHGEATYLVCRHVNEPGPGADNGPHHDFTINQVYFGGNARFFENNAWSDGYWFDVMAEDHGEGKGAKAGGPDYYHITIRKMSGQNASGNVVYDAEANMSGGNIQIHPPNNGHPYTSSSLPSWVSLQP